MIITVYIMHLLLLSVCLFVHYLIETSPIFDVS